MIKGITKLISILEGHQRRDNTIHVEYVLEKLYKTFLDGDFPSDPNICRKSEELIAKWRARQ